MATRGTRLARAFTVPRWIALGLLAALVIAAVVYPVFGGHDPLAQDLRSVMQPLGTPGHLLGTDELGRDVTARLLSGARVELIIALGATLIALLVGTLLGMLGAYFGGIVEVLTMRAVTDVLLTFPPVVLALLVVSIYGPGAATLIVVMGLLFAPTFARQAYGETLGVRRAEYMEAAEAFGAPRRVELFRIVLPNISGPLTVQFSLIMAASILLESGLSYLGLGVVPPAPSWGAMVASGQRYMSTDLQLIMIPSLAVVLTILCFGLIGDALRDWLDPRGRS